MNRDDQPTPWFRKIWPLSRRWRPRHAPRPLAPHRACRPLCFESCESRRLLNGTGVISGTVFADPAGSTPLENAVVQLFEDTNGDREFDAGDIAIASDVSAPGTGAYEFSALADGRYFVQQQPLAAPLAAVLPAHYTVDIMGGSAGSLIDDFDAPDPLATFFINGIDADPKAMPAIGPKIEGGQRDALIDVQGTPNAISATGFFGQGVFNLGSATPGTLAILEYDGPDADHTSPIVNGHGLDLDATNHGANSGISVYFNTIQVGGVATRMGLEATLTGPMGESAFYTGLVPESTGPSSFFIPFTAFAVSSGFSFENVDSLSFLFNPTTMLDVDFVVDRIALNDPSGVTYDFVNEVPGIDVEKSTNGQDADLPTGPLVAVGDGVTWQYVVSNTGNVPLGHVQLADDQGVTPQLIASGNGDAVLDVGETWTYEATGTAAAGPYANTATVTALDSREQTVTDADPSHYFGDLQDRSSVSGYVYVDINNDGLFNRTVESPIPNATVVLRGTDNWGNPVLRQTVTNADGHYRFDDLRPGTYTAIEVQPEMYLDGRDTLGNLGGSVSDDRLSDIRLPVEAAGVEYNFGERGLKAIYASKRLLLWPPGAWDHLYDGSAGGANAPGIYDPATSRFLLGAPASAGGSPHHLVYGAAGAGWLPLAGDWSGDGTATVGLYDPTTSCFLLRDSHTAGMADYGFAYGPAGGGWRPIVGDWDGDGIDTVGLYDPATSQFLLRNSLDGGFADAAFAYGPANSDWLPIAGDWDGDGIDTVGFYDPATSQFLLRNSLSTGFAEVVFAYGPAGSDWLPIAGDWDGNGVDTVGLFDQAGARFLVKNTHESGYADSQVVYESAAPDVLPVVGDWGGSAQPLLAASVLAQPAEDAVLLSSADLPAIAAEALAGWGPAAENLDVSAIDFLIADLPGATLGLASHRTIYLDRDAAGHGWFVDPTPGQDEEFSRSEANGQATAVDPRAVDRIDLLTVVAHELGHVLGLEDSVPSSDRLMEAVLGTGQRREPGPSEFEAVFAGFRS